VGKEPPKISSKVDVWSVGVIFYQCLYGKKVTTVINSLSRVMSLSFVLSNMYYTAVGNLANIALHKSATSLLGTATP